MSLRINYVITITIIVIEWLAHSMAFLMIMLNDFCDCFQDWQTTSARRLQPKLGLKSTGKNYMGILSFWKNTEERKERGMLVPGKDNKKNGDKNSAKYYRKQKILRDVLDLTPPRPLLSLDHQERSCVQWQKMVKFYLRLKLPHQ